MQWSLIISHIWWVGIWSPLKRCSIHVFETGVMNKRSVLFFILTIFCSSFKKKKIPSARNRTNAFLRTFIEITNLKDKIFFCKPLGGCNSSKSCLQRVTFYCLTSTNSCNRACKNTSAKSNWTFNNANTALRS